MQTRRVVTLAVVAAGLATPGAHGVSALPTPTVTPTPTVRCTDLAPTNPCIPGRGSQRLDCHLEWVVTPVPALRREIPKNRSICYESDRGCDFDLDPANKSCTFHAALCINNSDPRLSSCVPSDLATFEVTQPKASGDAADLSNLAVLETQAGNGTGAFHVSVVRKKTPIANGSPNPTPDLCSAPLSIVVPLKERASGTPTSGRRTLSVTGTTSAGKHDSDSLKLECRPSTCGNGIIETDHEDCDDGNNTSGDGCDQGCRLERFGVIASGDSISQPAVVDLVKGMGASWVRVNLTLDGTTTNDQPFKLFLDAGVNVVVTISNHNPANADTAYGTLADWPGAGFPFASKDRYQQDIRDSLAPVLSVLGSGRLWVQCENEVGDASVNPEARFWRGTTDQYLAQLAAFYEVLHSINPFARVVLSSFASENLNVVIDPNDPRYDYQVGRLTQLLATGQYDAADLHFYHCAEDIPTKVRWVKEHMPAGKRWISTENGGPDSRCSTTPISWTQNATLFEGVQALQVSTRLSACADNGGSVCLWFSLFDLKNETDAFSHLGLLDQGMIPPRQKPAFDAFKAFAATHR